MSSRWALSSTTPVDANGKPSAVLGTLTFFVTGTTTKLDAYSDAGNSSALANPYTLGSDGKIPDVFLGLSRYKIVLLDSTGATIETWDPVDKSLERIKSAGKPSPCYASLQYWDTNDNHLKEIASDGTTVIDRGNIDSQINAASVTDQITGTSAVLSSTPASVGALWLSGTCAIVTNNISLPAGGGGVFTCATASTTLTTISSSTQGREIEIIFSNSQTITHGSGINTIGAITYTVPAGARVRFRRNSSDWTIIWQCFPASPGRLGRIATQYFAASGTYTRTKGCAYAFVRTIGPGGGGASSDTGTGSNGSVGAGGGAGGYCEEWVTPAATETVTIGTGGAAQTTANTAGNNGSGASSFGSYHSAGAGQGGAAMANGSSNGSAVGGAGGAASNGGLNINGQAGGAAGRFSSVGGGVSGAGGSNPLGIGGTAVAGTTINGNAGVGYGAGGSGGSAQGSSKGNGGAGTDGICIVDEYAMT